MKKRYLRLVRKTFRALRHRRLRHRSWWQKLTRPLFHRNLWMPCRDTVAHGLAIGLFFAVMPMPFQSFAAAIVAMRARANVPFAMVATWLSNPFTNVPIWLAQVKLGSWLHEAVGVPMPHFLTKVHINIPGAGSLDAASFIFGSIISGILLGLSAYPIVHLFSALLPQYLPTRGRRLASAPSEFPSGEI